MRREGQADGIRIFTPKGDEVGVCVGGGRGGCSREVVAAGEGRRGGSEYYMSLYVAFS